MSNLLRKLLRLGILSAFAFHFSFAANSTARKLDDSKSTSADHIAKTQPGPVLVKVHLLDSRGLPLSSSAQVRLFSTAGKLDVTAAAQQSSSADFPNTQPGDYDLEITSPGFKKTTQHLHVVNRGADLSVFIYVPTDSEAFPDDSQKHSPPVKSNLQNDINRGVELLQKKQFEKAAHQFSKVSRAAPENPDVWCLLGLAESGQQHDHLARNNFEQALFLNPVHEDALLGLAQLDLQTGQAPAAIDLLQKAYRYHGAGWKTHYLLASAYLKNNQLPEAEAHALHAVDMAERDGAPDAAPAAMLLADIYSRQDKIAQATQIWQRVSKEFPASSEARQAIENFRKTTADSSASTAPPPPSAPAVTPPVEGLSLDSLPEFEPSPARAQEPPRPIRSEESPWAPSDVDNREYLTADGVACNTEEVLDLAQDRLNSQLLNFEKFTATEHVVHQEIEHSGTLDPAREKDFSYIVFVYPYLGNSLYLEESRDGGSGFSDFPTAMVTTGINSLGVALLQPANRSGFTYRCEGLTSVRGQAAWQIRFEEKSGGTNGTGSIRRWRTNKASYNLRVKGRVWITSTSFDMLRIQTDLIEPVRDLALTRDHLEVNYGPVSFRSGNQQLWLPWNADMYMEYQHKRFHHRHFLTDYMLFGVDETQKVAAPKSPPPPVAAPTTD